MEKRRWKLGDHELTYNPKSYDGSKASSGDVKITANGVVSSNNLYHQDELQFTFDIYEKPTHFDKSIVSFNSGFYNSISQTYDDSVLVLRASGNFYDKYDTNGSMLISGNRNLIDFADMSDFHAWRSGTGGYNYAVQQPDDYWRVERYYSGNTSQGASEILFNKSYAVKPNTAYTQSFLFKSDGDASFGMTFFTNGGHNNRAMTFVDLGNGVKKAYATYTTNSTDASIRAMDLNSFTGTWNYIEVKDCILEEGSTVGKYIIGSENYLGNGSGTAVALTTSSNSNDVAAFFTSGDLVINAENGTQISKYTYTDQEVKDTASITWDGGNFLYLLNKFGKIFKVDKTTGVVTPQFSFGDFTDNKLANNPLYKSIHFYDTSYIGVLCGNRVMYLNMSYDTAHSIEISNRTISGISYGFYAKSFFAISPTTISAMYPNLSTMEVDKIKSQLSNGAITIVDENNISNVLSIKQMTVKRIRNLQESRYEIGINGQIS